MKKSFPFMIITFFVMVFISINSVKAYTFGSNPLLFRVQGTGDYSFSLDNGGWYVANSIPSTSSFKQFNLFFNSYDSSLFASRNVKLSLIMGIRSATDSVGMSNSGLMVQTISDSNSICTTNSISEENLNGLSTGSLSLSGMSLYQITCHISGWDIPSSAYSLYFQGVYTSNVPLSLYVLDSLAIEVEEDVNYSSIISAINSQSSQQHQDAQDIKNNTKETNDLIKSDDASGGEAAADSLVNNSAFDDSTGLSGIISMPLTFVSSLSNTCQPISLTIPYMDYTFELPCFQSIINNYMPALVVVIKVIVNGLIIYWVMLDIFKIVKSAKNPDDDRIEVLDL